MYLPPIKWIYWLNILKRWSVVIHLHHNSYFLVITTSVIHEVPCLCHMPILDFSSQNQCVDHLTSSDINAPKEKWKFNNDSFFVFKQSTSLECLFDLSQWICCWHWSNEIYDVRKQLPWCVVGACNFLILLIISAHA